MKHEPGLAIHMEKQLGWAHKLGGVEPQGISKVGQTMLARLICYQLAGPEWGGFIKEAIASACLNARHFSFFLHTTGAFQAATPVLELRGSESE